MKRYFYGSILIYIMFYFIILPTPHRHVELKLLLRGSLPIDLIKYVNVFYGTGLNGGSAMSTGNLFPVVSLPFGNNHWTITTNGQSPWFYRNDVDKIEGIRCSHQPSPWIGDYAFFDIARSVIKTFDRGLSTFTPSFMYVVYSDKSQIKLVPTNTGAVITFKGVNDNIILKRLKYDIVSDYMIVGTATETSVFGTPDHTILHVVISSNTKLNIKLTVSDDTIFRIGTSFISEEQARENIPKTDQRLILKDNDQAWNKLLERVHVTGRDDKQLRKFYSILYRTLLFPRSLKENDRHYSPYSVDGVTYPGEISTDSGFWDSYRTVYPFLHLVYPEIASRILNGYVNSIRESPDKLLAQWASPDKVDSMEGSMGEISISEGIMNDAITDVDTAWKYLYKSCCTNSGGREKYDLYEKHGYIPGNVALSLNYYLTDYVVSLAARKLGHNIIADKLLGRSNNWKIVFDKDDTLFFRPKNKNGNFEEPFNEFKWTGAFREASAWQYRYYVPHDPVSLDSYGYNGKMCKYLDDMMTNPYKPTRLNGIHEKLELYNHMFGQYSHNNQPSHHILYMYQHVGCGKQGQKWIKYVLENSYTETSYPGDEDNGSMSSWFILSSIGLYSLVPGDGKYQVGIKPLWKTVDIDHGRIVITSDGKDNEWDSVSINGNSQLNYIQFSSENKYDIKFN